jgi:hypothetical protein
MPPKKSKEQGPKATTGSMPLLDSLELCWGNTTIAYQANEESEEISKSDEFQEAAVAGG